MGRPGEGNRLRGRSRRPRDQRLDGRARLQFDARAGDSVTQPTRARWWSLPPATPAPPTRPRAPANSECGGYPAALARDHRRRAHLRRGRRLHLGLLAALLECTAPGRSSVPRAEPRRPRSTADTERDRGLGGGAVRLRSRSGFVLSQDPGLDVVGLQHAITSTVTRIPGLDVAYGIVNADAALRDAGSGTPAPDTHVELETFTDASPVGKDVEVRATVTDRSDAGSAANASSRSVVPHVEPAGVGRYHRLHPHNQRRHLVRSRSGVSGPAP